MSRLHLLFSDGIGYAVSCLATTGSRSVATCQRLTVSGISLVSVRLHLSQWLGLP